MEADDLWVLPKPLARHPFISGRTHRSSGCCYNIVSEDNLRMAAQKTTMYVDTLPTKRVPGWYPGAERLGPLSAASDPPQIQVP
jgi:hypothetical protein